MSENQDQYNRGGMWAFLLSMAFVFIFFVVIIGGTGIDLQENIQDPPTGQQLAAVVDVSKIAEPWVANDDMVAHGKKVYQQNCALCHGAEGKGDGQGGAALNPKPRDLVEGKWKAGGGFTGIFKVASEGLPGTQMVGFSHLKLVDRWAVTQFINSITQGKVQEDPAKVAEFAKAAK